MQTAIPTMLMRGGTSKGLYFAAKDLPADPALRDKVLLAAMGSPDIRQIDGVGGAHPLTSKVAILSPSKNDDADIDYYFLQVVVDEARVSDSQPCGNILAGVGPWAIEHKIIDAQDGITSVRIRTVNNASLAVAHVSTPQGKVNYAGETAIDGVPGTSAPIPIEFLNIAGANCGALFPTGNLIDTIEGVEVTCIDNGMPVILLRASDFDLSGNESPKELENNSELREIIEKIRLAAGLRMNLGDVASKTVPKMTLISPPGQGGTVSTRSFIPHRIHDAIGVLGAVSVATACAIKGTVGDNIASPPGETNKAFSIEHPTGAFNVEIEIDKSTKPPCIKKSALLRTARPIMRGEIYIPHSVWSGA